MIALSADCSLTTFRPPSYRQGRGSNRGREALTAFADGRLRVYFADFKSYKVLGQEAAKKALAEGKDVRQVEVERYTAQPPGSQAVEVATKAQALRLADELPGTCKHRRRGAYRVVPLEAQRPRRVPLATAKALQAEGWDHRPSQAQGLDARQPCRGADPQ